MKGIPQEYMGNAVTLGTAKSTVGHVLDKGLGWAAWLLNSVVASFDEAQVRGDLASWAREPKLVHARPSRNPAYTVTGSSPRFDVYGNDFGWGRPVAVRSGAGNKLDGKATVYEGWREGVVDHASCRGAPHALCNLSNFFFLRTISGEDPGFLPNPTYSYFSSSSFARKPSGTSNLSDFGNKKVLSIA